MVQARPGDPGRPDAPALGRLGGVVAGRYRLDEPRPTDLPGAERWTATDQILARPVVVTLVSGDRTAAVLDAARRAALVVEPRLARILDVGTADGTGYVVTAAVEGRSLAALAGRAPLPADQARAVIGEAAAALEAARRRGVHHLALRPDALVLTDGGRVVLEGLAVDGEIVGASGGTAHAMSRADAVGLVRVLYAALTGRWPAVAASGRATVPSFAEWSAGGTTPHRDAVELDPGLPLAPEHDGAPLPPVDLVASVPADLDTLCAVTLGPHDDGPHSPGELVRELEPWRAVRADEIFRAADAGRWPALPGQGPATGTTTAPPTGSSPMSDDQHPAADDTATPASGSPRPAERSGSGAGPRGGAGAAGSGAAGTAGAGAAAAAAGAAAGAAAAGVAGAASAGGAGAQGAGGAGAAGGTAAAAGGTAAAAGGVARQSVRSAFGSAPSAGSRRPGTPPPAIPPAGQPASIPPAAGRTSTSTSTSSSATGPVRTSTRATPAVPAGAAGAGSPTAGSSAAGSSTAGTASPADTTAAGASPVSASSAGATPPGAAGTDGARTDGAGSATSSPAPTTTGAPDSSTGSAPGDLPPSVPPARSASPAEPAPATEPSAEPSATAPTTAAPAVPAASTTPAASTSPAAPDATPAPAGDAAPDVPADGTRAFPSPHGAEDPHPLFPGSDAPATDPGATRPQWDLPFPAEEHPTPVSQRRIDPTRWVLGGVAVAVVVGLVIAIGNVLAPFRSDDDAGTQPAPVASAPATQAPADAAQDPAAGEQPAPATAPPAIASVSTIDPSDGDGEHEELVGRLVDGDPATSWYTHTYNRPDYAGFKDAVGLVVTLQAPATVTSVTLDVNGSGGAVEVRATDAANPTAGDVLASGPLSAQTVLTLAQPTETQTLVLWFPALAQTPDGQNRIEISTIAVS